MNCKLSNFFTLLEMFHRINVTETTKKKKIWKGKKIINDIKSGASLLFVI